MKNIDLINTVFPNNTFYKIKGFDNCVIGVEVETNKIVYSVKKIIKQLKTKKSETDAIDYFYSNIFLYNVDVVFCEDFFYYDKF